MLKFLACIQKHFIVSLPVAMGLGLLYGWLGEASWLTGLITPLVVLMVFPLMMGIDFRSLWSGVDIKLQAATQALNFLVIPFVAFFLGVIFLPDQPYLSLGLLILGLLPAMGGTMIWTGFCRGNVTASVKMVVIGLVLGGLLTPVYINFLMGQVLTVPFWLILEKMAYIIFLPMIVAICARWFLIRQHGREYFQNNIKPVFGVAATLGLIAIVFIGLSLRAQYIINNPQIILWLLVPLLFFYIINYTIAATVAKMFFSKADGIALVFGSTMRHLAISLAVAFTVFRDKGADIVLLIALAFILQPQFAAWFMKLKDRIFGPDEAGMTE